MINAMLDPHSEILDLGCGTGRLAEPLSRAGHQVVGVDNEPAMLDELELTSGIVGDIERLDLGRRFDGVLLMSHFVDRSQGALTAAMRYQVDGEVAEQRFSARDIDDAILTELAAVAGLRIASVLDEAGTLLALRPVAGNME